MLNSEDWSGRWWGFHLEFVSQAPSPWQHILASAHQKLSGQTALCHHWNPAGYIANFPPKRWRKNGNCVRKRWAGEARRRSQRFWNVRGGSGGRASTRLQWATLPCGGNQWLIFLHFPVGRYLFILTCVPTPSNELAFGVRAWFWPCPFHVPARPYQWLGKSAPCNIHSLQIIAVPCYTGRAGTRLQTRQPGEQHGFRAGHVPRSIWWLQLWIKHSWTNFPVQTFEFNCPHSLVKRSTEYIGYPLPAFLHDARKSCCEQPQAWDTPLSHASFPRKTTTITGESKRVDHCLSSAAYTLLYLVSVTLYLLQRSAKFLHCPH